MRDVDPNNADEKKVCQRCGREYTITKYPIERGCRYCSWDRYERWLAYSILFFAIIYGIFFW
jgi:hypothetical protein